MSWIPTDKQKTAKAQFWQTFSDMQGWRTADSFSIQELANMSLVPTADFKRWIENGEFQAWFLNKHSAKQRLLAQAEVVADELLQVALNEPEGKGGIAAKIKACELILKFTGMEPTRKHEHITKDTKGLGPEELDKLLTTQLPRYLSGLSVEDLKKVLGDQNLGRLQALPAEVSDE